MAKIIRTEKSDNGMSYLIDFGNNMILWFDTWEEDGELTGDWNKYIFYTDSKQDVLEKEFQEASNEQAGAYNYQTALDLINNQL